MLFRLGFDFQVDQVMNQCSSYFELHFGTSRSQMEVENTILFESRFLLFLMINMLMCFIDRLQY